MPLTLTTPVSTGDLDPAAASYAKIKVTEFSADLWRGLMVFHVSYGNVVDDVWVGSHFGRREFKISGQEFLDLITTHATLDDELTYDAVARGLYQWLIDNGHYAGTID